MGAAAAPEAAGATKGGADLGAGIGAADVGAGLGTSLAAPAMGAVDYSLLGGAAAPALGTTAATLGAAGIPALGAADVGAGLGLGTGLGVLGGTGAADTGLGLLGGTAADTGLGGGIGATDMFGSAIAPLGTTASSLSAAGVPALGSPGPLGATAGLPATPAVAAPTAGISGIAPPPAAEVPGPMGAGPAATAGPWEQLQKVMQNPLLRMGLQGAQYLGMQSQAGQARKAYQDLLSRTQGNINAAQSYAPQIAGLSPQIAEQLGQAQTGQASPAQKVSLDKWANEQKQRIKSQFASMGLADSTMAQTAIGDIDTQRVGLEQQLASTNLNDALRALGFEQQAYTGAADIYGQGAALNQSMAAQMINQNAQIQDAMVRYLGSVGYMQGAGGAGTSSNG